MNSEKEIRDVIAVLMVRLLEADGPLTGPQMTRGLATSRKPIVRISEEEALQTAFGAMRRADMVTDMSTSDVSRWALTHRGRIAAQELARRSA